MSTPNDPPETRFDRDAQVSATERAHDAPLYAPGGETPPPADAEISLAAPHPDNPPWGLLVSFGIVIASFILMLVLQFVFIIPYALTLGTRDPVKIVEVLRTDKTVILLSILALIPAHLLTLLLCWLVVTGAGKRPFWRSLGWGWSPRFGFLACVGLTLAMHGFGVLAGIVFGDQENEMTRMLMSSAGARYAIAALATFTAPVVEEVVYRGLLYSALRKRISETASVLIVVGIFALIHVPQYLPSVAVILTITVLSLVLTLVRARTGRLLPCIVIHMIFNAITSAFIVFAPQMLEKAPPAPTPPAPPGAMLHSLLAPLVSLFT